MLADWYGKKPSSLPYNKDWGACQKLKKKKTLRGTKLLFCGRGLKIWSPPKR